MGNVLGGLQPKLVWDIFEEICGVPHPSKKEEKIAAWIVSFAEKHNLLWKKDALGNIVIKKPATPGMENRKPVAIQGHIDMVCEKNSDVEFDFDKDPIQPWIDGDWVKAKGTTLGADNGIGVAMGLAVLASNDIQHPPMEVLCTLDEETGLTGAIQLGTDLLDAQIMINLDSEDDGTFTIGCAGGLNTAGHYNYIADAVPANSVAYTIAVKGLKGGHSGIEIHDGRGNAIKFLNRILWHFQDMHGLRVASFNGGNKHNAIPRESFALVTIPKANETDFLASIAKCNKTIQTEFLTKEPNVNLTAVPAEMPAKVMEKDMQFKLLSSIYAMPHGVIRMSPDIAGLVQTSTNLAIIETRENEVYILTSQRSSSETEKANLGAMVKSAFLLGGAEVVAGDGYPGWQPNMNSPILKTALGVFKNLRGFDAKVEAIHAGLECGLIGEKYPGMDMLSFGPTMKDVHSPDERLNIPTVDNCFNLVKEILKNIPEIA